MLFLADAAIDVLHIEHPDWPMTFDEDPAQSEATRRELLGRAADEGLLVDRDARARRRHRGAGRRRLPVQLSLRRCGWGAGRASASAPPAAASGPRP